MEQKTVQNIFFAWFFLLSVIVVYNFYYISTVSKNQEPLVQQYAENKQSYEDAINQHQQFTNDIQYLKGRVEGIQPCSTK